MVLRRRQSLLRTILKEKNADGERNTKTTNTSKRPIFLETKRS